MTLSTSKRVVFYGLLALLAALSAGLVFSAGLRHQTHRIMVKAEMVFAKWRGHPAQLVSLSGNLGIAGAQIQALDSRSGWAALADREGRFLLLDVMWYPGARYDLVLSTDGQTGKAISVTSPKELPGSRIIDLGSLSFDGGRALDLRGLPGITAITQENYDVKNGAFYRDLYTQLTAGKQTDEALIGALNDYVATKLNYNETQWDIGSPRRILETGSQYCDHLAKSLATLLITGHYQVREIHLSNGQTPPSTHAVVEVFYGGAWHLYDPTYGTVYRKDDSTIASYKELRLDPSLIKEDLFQRFEPDQRRVIAAMLLDIFRSGHHHIYQFKDQP